MKRSLSHILGVVVICSIPSTSCAELEHAQTSPNNSFRQLPSPSSSCDVYIRLGTEALQDGDVSSAVAIFQRGTLYHPNEASLWNNCAVALATRWQLQTNDGLNDDTYCEARASASLALRLGNADSNELLAALDQLVPIDDSPPSCRHDDIIDSINPVMELRREASEARKPGAIDGEKYMGAVRDACSAENMSIALSDEEIQNEQLNASTLHAIVLVFEACGLVALPNVYPTSQIEEAARAQAEHFYEQTVAQKPTSHINLSTVEVKRRGDALRQEVVCPLKKPFTDITSSSMILQTVRQALRTMDIELDTFSYIQSEAGSSVQKWHTDMGPLIDDGLVESSYVLPAYGLVMIVPLIDLDNSNGPTEFMPGSHLSPTAMKGGGGSYWHDAETGKGNTKAATVALNIPAGSALLFDIRTTHRGGANASPTARPILYASYFQEWFTDRINFDARQSQWWKGLEVKSEQIMKLFSRIDSRQYTKMLEDMLKERGVDLKEL